MTKKLIFVSVFYIGAFSCGAQEKSEAFDKLITRVQSYLDKTPVLYPSVTLNQTKYTPGDTVFFKAHFMDIANAPVKGRAVMQMILFNSTGKLTEKIFFNTKDGIGHSQMILPDSLTAGRYRIVVLNDWMRNFGTSTFFEQEISIVRGKELVKKESPLAVQFFAEGGTFVQSVPNKVVIFASQPGKQFTIADDKSQEITKVVGDATGMGFFVFTPQPGIAYYATTEGNSARFPLPQAVPDGVSILLTPNQNREPVRVLVTAPKSSKTRNEDLLLMLVSEQEIHYSASIKIGDKEAVSLAIPQKRLPEGIAQVLVVDESNKLWAQRSFLVQDQDSLRNRFTVAQPSYSQREMMKLDVMLMDLHRNPLRGEFSVSVLNQGLFQNEDHFTPIDPTRVNDVLVSRYDARNWAGINTRLVAFPGYHPWNEVLKSSTRNQPHPLRTLVHKNGRAVFKTTGEPVPDSTIITVYLQRHFMGYEATVSKGGKFGLAFLFDFYGKDELFYVAELRGNILKDVILEWEENDISRSPMEPWVETEKPDVYGEFRAKSKLITPSYSFFLANTQDKTNELINPNAEFEDEFMGADLTVNVEDYVVFPTMEELIREVIPSLQHRKTRAGNTVRVVFSVPSILPTGDPIYIIDGVMTKNSEFFMSLRPADILTVKIEKDLGKLTRLGAIGKNGIVYVQTKRQETVSRLRQENTIVTIQGLNKPVESTRRMYEAAADWHNPDFRSTIYWNPSLKTDASGESTLTFFLGDDVGPVKLGIQGFTEDGHPVGYEKEITVNFATAAKN